MSLRCLPFASDNAVAVFDHVLELVPEMFHETLHRPRRRVAKCTDRVTFDLVGDIHQHVEILFAAFACEDSLQHAIHPAGTFPAWRTLTAGLRVVEARNTLEHTDHARRYIHDDHGTRA